MEKSLDEIAGVLERLSDGLKDLESRVAALEHTAARPGTLDYLLATPPTEILTDAAAETENYVAAIGKAILGIAGAYLLRAIAESHTAPFAIAVGMAVVYAGGWLWAAARVKLPRRFAAIAYSATAVLILLPMLWETTTRFHALSPAVTAAVLAAIALGTMAVCAQHGQESIVWVVLPAAIFMALALMVSTLQLAPFIVALLVICAAAEFARWYVLRWIAAMAVNVAMLDLLYVIANNLPAGDGLSGVALALESALVLIYGGSAVFRIVTSRPISVFEMWQPLIAIWVLVKAPLAMVIVLGIAAVVAVKRGKTLHEYAYLVMATILSGVWWYGAAALIGAATSAPPVALWIVLSAALACYWLGDRIVAPGAVALGAVSAAAFGVSLVGADPAARTLLICASAVIAAWAGRRWTRVELTWIARSAMAVGAVKLVVDDFRHARPAAVAVSLLCYGGVLILLPRWTKKRVEE